MIYLCKKDLCRNGVIIMKYKRVLLKLSGEALAGPKGFGIDAETVQGIAKQIKEAKDLGVEVLVKFDENDIPDPYNHPSRAACLFYAAFDASEWRLY